MIKVIFFDVGGVLIDHIFTYLFHEISNNENIDYPYFMNLIKPEFENMLKGKLTENELFKVIINKFKLNLNVEEIERKSDSLFNPLKTLSIVDKLKGKVRLAIISDMGKNFAESIIKKLNLNIRFEKQIFSYQVGFRKPSKEIFEFALKEMNIEPNKCLFIDDKKENINAVKKLGMKGIIFENPKQLKEKLEKLNLL